MKNYFYVFLVTAFLVCSFGNVAYSQFFPKNNTLKELEEITADAEKNQIAAEKQAREDENLQRLNVQRLREFNDICRKFNTEFLRNVNTKEAGDTLAILFTAKEFYWRGRIFYYQMSWSKTFAELKVDMRDNDSVTNQNGSSAQLQAFAEMGSTWDGTELDDRGDRKVERKLDSLLKRFIPFEENKEFRGFKESRNTSLNATKKWLNDYTDNVTEFKKAYAELEANTFDHRVIWDMVNLLRDNFNLPLKAQEWVQVIKEKFPNDPYILMGYDIAYYAELMAQTGSLDEGRNILTDLRETIDDKAANLRRIRSDIETKMKEENLKKEDLNSEEQAILDTDIGSLRDALRDLIRSSIEAYRGFKQLLQAMENNRNQNNNWRDRFRDWGNQANNPRTPAWGGNNPGRRPGRR